MTDITYRTADVDGFNIFYREAGPAGAPKLLLLHGFPSSGHMFRDLIPLLAERFHIVTPDLPGFGHSDMPGRGHSFDKIADTIDRFRISSVSTVTPSMFSITAHQRASGLQ
jgi:pimeloyl-ACP methyl ester carboxylesterase